MGTAKIVSAMVQTYAWLRPAQTQDKRKLQWQMNERTLADLAKSPYARDALVFLPDPRFFFIPIEVISTEVMQHGEVKLVIEVA